MFAGSPRSYVKILPVNLGKDIKGIQRGSRKKCGEDCD